MYVGGNPESPRNNYPLQLPKPLQPSFSQAAFPEVGVTTLPS